ncbi:MAG: tRNA (adenosine(37)-N6)-threonylcarbamoyltransferase complex transferase subunit TsaD [Candidatus Latescibacteria bacterium]|nr:tRNA (adenosine(37)-N6)-threonylcarbamoyltransferase complex transferase subunit TsaD [Candidatus Latescibacterota bacterium]
MTVLGIETSCDDTSAAVYDTEKGLLSLVISSQMEHAEFGGVVPELASRAHLSLILPVIDQALSKANLILDDIDSIAVTAGPGLVGSLLVGVSAGKAIALARNIPLIGVHHIEGHIYSNFIAEPFPPYPSIALVVSGGHTELIMMKAPLEYEVLGKTRDDAAGEAFDKIAKLLGLGYPGGPAIEKKAHGKNSSFVDFPISKVPGYEFSFSGLKTAVKVYVNGKEEAFVRCHLADILASFQQAVVQALVEKTLKALTDYHVDTLLLAGGVAANRALRDRVSAEACRLGFTLFEPPIIYCTDNAAMIARAGHERLMSGITSPLSLSPEARLPLRGAKG